MTRDEMVLHEARVSLVRKYLAYPQGWPDGIDWGSHWYTTNKDYWDTLARAPVTSREAGLPKTVTETPVTKTKTVTETPTVTKTVTAVNVTEVVASLEKSKGGRPKTGSALSAAERMRKKRAAAKK